MDEQNSSNVQQAPGEGASRPDAAAEHDKRLAARRRFLRMGAAGGTALVVTVTHKRAFAGKKGSVASNCVSLQGTPDLTSAKQKKALEVSAMGTPKGLICRPRTPIKGDPVPGNCSLNAPNLSQFRDINGLQYQYVDPHQLDAGCGDLQTTVQKSFNYRLYEKGYCPITYDPATGAIGLDKTAKYYKLDKGVLVPQDCQ